MANETMAQSITGLVSVSTMKKHYGATCGQVDSRKGIRWAAFPDGSRCWLCPAGIVNEKGDPLYSVASPSRMG